MSLVELKSEVRCLSLEEFTEFTQWLGDFVACRNPGSRTAFLDALAAVPDVPPEPGDELPEGYQGRLPKD